MTDKDKNKIKRLLDSTINATSTEELRRLVKAGNAEVKRVKKSLDKASLLYYVPHQSFPKEFTNEQINKMSRQKLASSIQEHKAFIHKGISVPSIRKQADRALRNNKTLKGITDPREIRESYREYKSTTVDKATGEIKERIRKEKIFFNKEGQRVYERYDEYGRKVFVTAKGKKNTYSKTTVKSMLSKLNEDIEKYGVKHQYGSKVLHYISKMKTTGKLKKRKPDNSLVDADINEVYEAFMRGENRADVLKGIAEEDVFNELKARFSKKI